jgi:hypothetical protein
MFNALLRLVRGSAAMSFVLIFAVTTSYAEEIHSKPGTAQSVGQKMEKSLPSPLQKLIAAENFADAIQGESPTLKAEYLAYKEAASALPTFTKEQLEYLISHGTPAGRLYGAVLLTSKIGPAHKDQCYAPLLHDDTQVLYLSGCRGSMMKVKEIAKSLLETGKFINFHPLVYCSVPLPEQKQTLTKYSKIGMTRASAEKLFSPDGGLSSSFHKERYVANNSKHSDCDAVVKIDIVFKPAGMSDEVFYLGKWVAPKQSSADIVMNISAPYLEKPFYD